MYITSVSNPADFLVYIGYALIGIAAIALIIGIISYYSNGKDINKGVFTKMIVLFVALLMAGAIITFTTGSGGASKIEVGPHFIAINAQFIGSKNYTSSEIMYAYVENINSGNLTLGNRIEGSGLESYSEGIFTLSNGQTAYVIDISAIVLIVHLQNGNALVLGPSNTTALANYFNKNVFPVSGI
jgi:hypothetical protein